MDRQPIKSVSIADNPQWAVITNSSEWGYGVFSWNMTKQDAKHNASITGGKVLPVDYVDGKLIIPSLAKAVIKKKLGEAGLDEIFGD